MNIAWDDLRTVLMLIRFGSLAGAADALDVNYTTVARRIKRAEDACGQRLFDRLPDGYRATPAARIIAKHAAEMEQTEQGMKRQLVGTDTDLSGVLTITASPLLITKVLTPVLEEFTQAYPSVDLRVLATNAHLNLARLEADLAIRISQSPGDALMGRRLLTQETASFASDAWAERIAKDPTAMIDWVVYDTYTDVPKGIDARYPNNQVRFRFDDMVAMVGAAQAGLGVVRMPLFLGRRTNGLVQVPILAPQPYTDIWVVGHPDVWHSKKLVAFREILIRHCKANQPLFLA